MFKVLGILFILKFYAWLGILTKIVCIWKRKLPKICALICRNLPCPKKFLATRLDSIIWVQFVPKLPCNQKLLTNRNVITIFLKLSFIFKGVKFSYRHRSTHKMTKANLLPGGMPYKIFNGSWRISAGIDVNDRDVMCGNFSAQCATFKCKSILVTPQILLVKIWKTMFS